MSGAAGAAGSAEGPVPIEPVITPITGTGSIYGSVLSPSGAPIGGAQFVPVGVTIAPLAPSGPSGTFVAGGLPLGRLKLRVTATGYLPRIIDSAATSEGFNQTIVLMPAPPAVTVTSAGATVSTGEAALTFAPGAYGSDVQVAAAWLTDVGITATAGPPLFVDDGGHEARVLGILHVDATVQVASSDPKAPPPSSIDAPAPATPVSVTLPVPADAAPENLALFSLDEASGAWVDPSEPLSISSGIATFSVPHFSDHALVERQAADGELVVSVSGPGPTYQLGSGPLVPVVPGTLIPNGAVLDLGAETVCSTAIVCGTIDNPCEVDGQSGSYDICRSHGKVELERSSGVETQTMVGQIESVTQIIERPAGVRPKGQLNKFQIRTRTRTNGGIRGTIARLKFAPCTGEPSAAAVEAFVSEGEVVLAGEGGGEESVTAGEHAVACLNCTQPNRDCETGLPDGSYLPTCTGCSATTNELRCAGCWDSYGLSHPATLPLPCLEGINNCEGSLVCGSDGCAPCDRLQKCCDEIAAPGPRADCNSVSSDPDAAEFCTQAFVSFHAQCR